MTPEHKVEWHGRAFFAEVAETLGIPTSEIMAAVPRGQKGMIAVLFTKDEEQVYSIILRRSRDGVLQRFTKPTHLSTVSALLDDLNQRLDMEDGFLELELQWPDGEDE